MIDSSSNKKASVSLMEAQLRTMRQDPTKETSKEYAERYSRLMAQIQTEKKNIILYEDLKSFRAKRIKRQKLIQFFMILGIILGLVATFAIIAVLAA